MRRPGYAADTRPRRATRLYPSSSIPVAEQGDPMTRLIDWTIWNVLYLTVLAIAIPAAIYHFSQERYGNFFMALLAFIVGLVALLQSRPRE
jgi:hypothetical protein